MLNLTFEEDENTFTHWGLDKMAAISQTAWHFQVHFLEWKHLIYVNCSLIVYEYF